MNTRSETYPHSDLLHYIDNYGTTRNHNEPVVRDAESIIEDATEMLWLHNNGHHATETDKDTTEWQHIKDELGVLTLGRYTWDEQ